VFLCTKWLCNGQISVVVAKKLFVHQQKAICPFRRTANGQIVDSRQNTVVICIYQRFISIYITIPESIGFIAFYQLLQKDMLNI
jgi:hypothetical protein